MHYQCSFVYGGVGGGIGKLVYQDDEKNQDGEYAGGQERNSIDGSCLQVVCGVNWQQAEEQRDDGLAGGAVAESDWGGGVEEAAEQTEQAQD